MNKKLYIAIMFLIIALSIVGLLRIIEHQNDVKPEIQSSRFIGSCEELMEMAALVMEYRQNGVPMKRFMRIASNPTEVLLVVTAYKIPIYSDKYKRQQAIDDFEKTTYYRCKRKKH